MIHLARQRQHRCSLVRVIGTMDIATLASGEIFEARLVKESDGVQRLLESGAVGRETRRHELAVLLKTGWRIVDASPAEQALLNAHGFGD